MSEAFDLGRAIYEVRALEDKMNAMEDELKEKLKPLKEYVIQTRAAILEHLNATNQKSTQTEYGGAYWKPKITYRVEDKEEFRRHVIGMEQWELLSWAAAPNACEEFTEEHAEPPPGLVRNSVTLLYVTPPTKANAAAAAKKNGTKAAE